MVKGPVEMKINQPQDLAGGAVLETSLSKEGGAVSVTGRFCKPYDMAETNKILAKHLLKVTALH